MTIKASPLLLNKVLNIEEIEKLLHNFTSLTKIDVSLVDVFGNEVISERIDPSRSVCHLVKGLEYFNLCQKNTKYAIFKAAELGEPYTFKCGEMIRCIAPVFSDGMVLGGVSLGPVLLWDTDDFVPLEFNNLKKECGFNEEQLATIISYTTRLSAQKMNSAAELLAFIVGYICQEENEFFKQRTKIMMQQRQISELIQEQKEMPARKRTLSKEKDLERDFVSLVLLGDKAQAMGLLTEILGRILSKSKANLNIIKTKLLELLTELSKTASEMGSQSLELASTLVKYTAKIVSENNFDQMFLWAQEAVEELTSAIYLARGFQKSNENIIKATNYIKMYYNEDLKLEDVAEHIYINPYYLSHLFKKELGITFSNYLRKIRLDNAIILIQKGEREVQRIASLVGYNNSSYFIKVFKNHVGLTPYNYIKVIEEKPKN